MRIPNNTPNMRAVNRENCAHLINEEDDICEFFHQR